MITINLQFNVEIDAYYLSKEKSKPAITRSKLTIKTLEQGVKYAQT